MFKTYEGELVLSSVKSTSDVALASEKFLFSVPDEHIAIQLKSLEGHRVVLHYKEKNGALPWRGSERSYRQGRSGYRGGARHRRGPSNSRRIERM